MLFIFRFLYFMNIINFAQYIPCITKKINLHFFYCPLYAVRNTRCGIFFSNIREFNILSATSRLPSLQSQPQTCIKAYLDMSLALILEVYTFIQLLLHATFVSFSLFFNSTEIKAVLNFFDPSLFSV